MAPRKPLNDIPAPAKPKLARKLLTDTPAELSMCEEKNPPIPPHLVGAPPRLPLVPKYQRRIPDPAERPTIDPHGYGATVKAFRVSNEITVRYREKLHDDGSKVRLYYIGALALGTAIFSPTMISCSFLHKLKGEDHARLKDEKHLHEHIRKLLEYMP